MRRVFAALLAAALAAPGLAQVNTQTGRTYTFGPTINGFSSNLNAANGSNSVVYGVNIVGDSNMVASAFGLQGGGNGTAAQLCIDWAIGPNQCVDKATQSNNAADMAYDAFFNFALSDIGNPLGVYICCSNEADNPTENTAPQYLGMRQTQEAVESYMTLGASERFMAFGAATSLVTFATDGTTFTAAKGVSTATTGSFIIPVTVGKNGVVYLWQYEYASGGGSFTVADITTVPAGTLLTDTITSSSTLLATGIGRNPVNRGTTWVGAARFTGLTPGYHLLSVNVTVSGKVGIVGFGSPANLKRGAGAPTLIAGNTIKEQYDANSTFTINTNANAILALNDVTGDGLNVTPADLYDANDVLLDYDSKAIIGYQITAAGSGMTNVVGATGSVTGSTCTSGIPQFKYTIAGGVLTQIAPTVTIGTTTTYAQACTVAGTVTISAGGTPPTVTPILSTNTNYNSQPPFHLSLRGAQHNTQAIEAAAQASIQPTTVGLCGTGTQTLSHQCHSINAFGAATITLPTNVSTPSLATLGIAPGECWDFTESSTAASAIISFTGGAGGNAAAYVIHPSPKNKFGNSLPDGARLCLTDNTGIYDVAAASNQLELPGIQTAGTTFTTTGCSVSATTGGATAGVFTLGANNCTVVVTMGGAVGFTAYNGWTCQAHDRTAISIVIDGESTSTTTTASFVIPVTAGATDVISFSCVAY